MAPDLPNVSRPTFEYSYNTLYKVWSSEHYFKNIANILPTRVIEDSTRFQNKHGGG